MKTHCDPSCGPGACRAEDSQSHNHSSLSQVLAGSGNPLPHGQVIIYSRTHLSIWRELFGTFDLCSHSCCTHTLLSLSLQSGVVMEFRFTPPTIFILTKQPNQNPHQAQPYHCSTMRTRGQNGEQLPVWLPPRSLLVLSGAARFFNKREKIV